MGMASLLSYVFHDGHFTRIPARCGGGAVYRRHQLSSSSNPCFIAVIGLQDLVVRKPKRPKKRVKKRSCSLAKQKSPTSPAVTSEMTCAAASPYDG